MSALARVAGARFISRSGTEAAFFVGIWGKAAYELEGSVGQIAWVTAALGLAGMIGSSIGGVLIDRFDARRVLLVSEIVFVPVALSFLFVQDFVQLVGAAFLLGLLASPINAAIMSMPPFITNNEAELALANARVESAAMAALISGTAVGAAMAAWIDIDAVFIFDAATSIVATLLVWGVRLDRRQTVEEGAGSETAGDRSALAELVAGFRYCFTQHRLRFYLLVGASGWLLFGVFSVVEPLFYRDVLLKGPETIGWVNTLFGLGLLGGTLLVARVPARLRTARIVLVLMAVNGLGAVVYVATADLRVVVAGGMLWGLVIGLFVPMVRTLLHLNSPEPMIGRIMGVSQVLGDTAKLLPLVFAPTLVLTLGIQGSLIAAGFVMIGLAAAAWRAGARLDRTRTVAVPAIRAESVVEAVDPSA